MHDFTLFRDLCKTCEGGHINQTFQSEKKHTIAPIWHLRLNVPSISISTHINPITAYYLLLSITKFGNLLGT